MVKDINAEEYEQLKESENTVVIDFHATWCGPCKILSPILEELQSEMENVEFVKLDVDQFPEISGANQVMGVPTVVILKNGEIKENNWFSWGGNKKNIKQCKGLTQNGDRCKRTSIMKYEECNELRKGGDYCSNHKKN